MKVAATAVPSIGNARSQPGAFKFFVTMQSPEVAGMNYLCPCGCGTVGEIRFVVAEQTPRSPTYLWDGSREKPTIVPAVRHIVAGQVCWEGVLQSGVWIGESHDPANGSSESTPGDPSGP